MIDLTDDIIIDPKTSCTREEAAAKNIGWLQGFRRKQILQLDKYGDISLDQYATAHSLDGTVLDNLQVLYDNAQRAFIEMFAEDPGNYDRIDEKQKAVEHVKRLIDRATAFLAKFDDEVLKGKSSALRIDRRATEESGVDHFTLVSVDEWAKSVGFSQGILHPEPTIADKTEEATQTDDKISPAIKPVNKATQSGELSDIMSDRLYISFAFLVEAFAATAPKFHHSNKTANLEAIAKRINEQVKAYEGGKLAKNQGAEAIKDRIEEAFRIRNKGPR